MFNAFIISDAIFMELAYQFSFKPLIELFKTYAAIQRYQQYPLLYNHRNINIITYWKIINEMQFLKLLNELFMTYCFVYNFDKTSMSYCPSDRNVVQSFNVLLIFPVRIVKSMLITPVAVVNAPGRMMMLQDRFPLRIEEKL